MEKVLENSGASSEPARALGGISPRVILLPIVVRELRLAARRPRTYYGRMMVAAVWVTVAAGVLFTISGTGISKNAGIVLFNIVSVALFGWSLLSAWAGCDSLSVEKREGTIGFLFLTDLKSHDIVLGKMVAAALPSFYAALAALPLLAICLLMGGVTAAQYAKTGLAILNVFFLGQAVGMFSSALCRLRGNVMGMPFLIGLLYLAAFGVASMAEEWKGWAWPAILFQCNNPARPFYLALEGSSVRMASSGYWLSLVVTYLHAWIFLGLAAWVLPRRWRENPKKAGFCKRIWERWRYGSMAARTAFRHRLVPVNPMLWLVCRGRFSPAFVWGWMGALAAGMAILTARETTQNGWDYSYGGCFVSIIITLQLMLRMGVPARAALLEEHRRSGSLEIMLCCTPMSVDDILDGMWLVVRRYYDWPTLVLLVVQGLMFIAALITGLRYSLHWDLLFFICLSSILLVFDLRAMAWMAMWIAMSNPKPRSAGPSAFFSVCLFPWALVAIYFALASIWSEDWFSSGLWVWFLYPTFALTNDTIICRLAQKRLRENFRLWAVPSYGVALGFGARLGRRLGLLLRRGRPSAKPAVG
jgi:ABC-type transport system involved in multi-copper enzyme maturation permease subunit